MGDVVSALLILVLCFAIGAAARRMPSIPADGWRVLNAWVIYVSLPALVLSAVHKATLRPELLVAAVGMWAAFAGAAGLAWLAVRRGWADRPTAGAWALCAGLGNTAFVGLPAIEALGGPDAARTATLVDQLGSFVAFSLLAVPFAAMMAGGEVKPGFVLRRVLTFPSFVALILAFSLHGVAFPAAVDDVLGRFAAMLSPLALASVGWQLNLRGLAGRGRAIATGLLFKEVFAPALVLGLMVATGSLGPDAQVAVTEAAMPPMVTAGVLATEHGLDRELASALIAVGLLTALVAVPLWWAVVQGMI